MSLVVSVLFSTGKFLHTVYCVIYTNFRDINLTNSESPPASKQAPNGHPYTSLIFLDFNSMYLWSQKQLLPLSPGLVWTLQNGKFKKKPLTNRQHSFESLQWLYYQQTKYDQTIQHAFHQGEKVIFLDKQYKVDGYAKINGRKTIFEYNGCTFHGCPCISNPTEKDKQDRINWIKRKTQFQNHGYKVISIFSCEWKKDLKQMKNPPKTKMGRILLQDDQVFYTIYTFLPFTHFYTVYFRTLF